MERSIQTGLVSVRAASWAYMAVVLVLARRDLALPVLAVALVAAAGVVTAVASVRRRPDARLLALELAVGIALLVADGWVYEAPHVFTDEQSLGVAWPLAGVLAAGVVLGPWGGIAVGVAFGGARAAASVAVATTAQHAWLGPLSPEQVLSLVTTTFLYALAGGSAGFLMQLIRRAERQIADARAAEEAARAREAVARTLHDGVLQTLALVARRTDDEQLADLARRQDRELRDFLFGTGDPTLVGTGELGDALREQAARFEAAYGGRAQVLVPDDLPELTPAACDALVGAVGEALANAGKHGRARHVTVFLEPTDAGGLFCSVNDDGTGFDPAETAAGVGLTRSIRARVVEVGGTVEVDSAPGRGAEVRLRIPPRPPSTVGRDPGGP